MQTVSGNVVDVSFRDDDVNVVDGADFYGCSFDNLTIRYRENNPPKFFGCHLENVEFFEVKGANGAQIKPNLP